MTEKNDLCGKVVEHYREKQSLLFETKLYNFIGGGRRKRTNYRRIM